MSVAPEPFPPARWRWRVFATVACPNFERTRSSLALHEAGHAVASLVMGFPHVLVTLGALDGRTEPGGLEQPPDAPRPAPPTLVAQEAAISLAAMAYAGLQAELLALRLRPEGAIRLGADEDEMIARAQLRAAFGCSTPAGYCQILARSLLSQNWHLVERIAAALIEHGALRAQIAEPGAMARLD